MQERDSYDLKAPNFVTKEFCYRISRELPFDRLGQVWDIERKFLEPLWEEYTTDNDELELLRTWPERNISKHCDSTILGDLQKLLDKNKINKTEVSKLVKQYSSPILNDLKKLLEQETTDKAILQQIVERHNSPILDDLETLLQKSKITKTQVHQIIKHHRTDQDTTSFDWSSFRVWYNYHCLEGYFLREYWNTNRRIPHKPKRIGTYRSADLQFAGFAYAGKKQLAFFEDGEFKKLEQFAIKALQFIDFDILTACIGMIYTIAPAWKIAKKDNKITSEINVGLKQTATYIMERDVNYCMSMQERLRHKAISLSVSQIHGDQFIAFSEGVKLFVEAMRKRHPIYIYFGNILKCCDWAKKRKCFQLFKTLSKALIIDEIESTIIFAIYSESFSGDGTPNNDALDPLKEYLENMKNSASELAKAISEAPDSIYYDFSELREKAEKAKKFMNTTVDHYSNFYLEKKDIHDCLLELKESIFLLGDLIERIRHKSNPRCQPHVYYTHFNQLVVSDLDILHYFYDRVDSEPIKINVILRHTTWSDLIDWEHGSDELKKLQKRCMQSFDSMTPVQKHINECLTILNAHETYLKYQYSDNPSASAIRSVRDLKLQDNSSLIRIEEERSLA